MRDDLKIWDILKSMRLLQKYKIPTVKSELTRKIEQAMLVAKKLGYPVALKIVSSTLTHKTDIGGVFLNIRNENELKTTYGNMLKSMKKKYPKAKINDVLVQKMITSGQEIIIGSKKDQQFGHVMMFGLGGIFTEVFNDVSFKIVPITEKDAESMIREIKGYKILQGYRGKKYDTKTLISILLKVSKLLEENRNIREIDINPVIVSNKGAVAVDARIIVV